MNKIEIAQQSKWLKAIETSEKALFGIFCHKCRQYSIYERVNGKAPKNYRCKHCQSDQTELQPWWIISQEMSENRNLQNQYSKALI